MYIQPPSLLSRSCSILYGVSTYCLQDSSILIAKVLLCMPFPMSLPNDGSLDSVRQLPQFNEAPQDASGQPPQPDVNMVDSSEQPPQPKVGTVDNSARRRPQPAREPADFFMEVDQPSFNLQSPIIISCHCNRVNGTVKALPFRSFGNNGRVEIDINHDYRARKYSGQLAVSYFPSFQPDPYTLSKTVCFRLGDLDRQNVPTLYFCPVCGCHLFREEWGRVDEKLVPTWAVATGVGEKTPASICPFRIARHINVVETGDGGLSIWMKTRNSGRKIYTDMPRQTETSHPADDYAPWMPTPLPGDVLNASCFCGTVKFHVTRPNHESTLPKSQYPDLMIPYYERSDEIPNPHDKKWWIRGNRYLAGTCACTSCRRCSGFDIQSWAFIPRANIFMHDSDKHLGLDFSNLPGGMLRSYNSSPGVTREFCPGCGATVFWHNTDRPELIDVSVGLFDAGRARAEDWLDWWKERVSFSEARCGSRGLVWDPVTPLETGLKESIEKVKEGDKLVTMDSCRRSED